MKKKLISIVFYVFSFIFLVYLGSPSAGFPMPPANSQQSFEEADIESTFRRAYFTNLTREEVINYYQKQYGGPSIRLNYPPEDSQTLVRDQTRSTFLEELTLPFRDSYFINGFEPKEAKDEIWYKGIHYRQKIIIKYVPTSAYSRIILGSITIFFVYLVSSNFLHESFVFVKTLLRRNG